MSVNNKSSNKVRVTKLFGGGGILGLMDPVVNLKVKYGTETRWIKALDSGNFQVSLAISSGGAIIAKAYPHDLQANVVDASGFGWNSASAGNTTVLFGHHGVFPSGVTVIPSSGMWFDQGNQIVEFARP